MIYLLQHLVLPKKPQQQLLLLLLTRSTTQKNLKENIIMIKQKNVIVPTVPTILMIVVIIVIQEQKENVKLTNVDMKEEEMIRIVEVVVVREIMGLIKIIKLTTKQLLNKSFWKV